MKNLSTYLAATALVGTGFATAIPAQADDVHLIGDVPPFCELAIDGGDPDMDFGIPQAGDSLDMAWRYLCNDHDGATIRMTSSEGGLESDDNEDFEVEYVATLTLGAFSLALDTGVSTNVNDIDVEDDIAQSNTVVTGNLNVTLSDNAPNSGGYSDTLTIDIEAN